MILNSAILLRQVSTGIKIQNAGIQPCLKARGQERAITCLLCIQGKGSQNCWFSLFLRGRKKWQRAIVDRSTLFPLSQRGSDCKGQSDHLLQNDHIFLFTDPPFISSEPQTASRCKSNFSESLQVASDISGMLLL